MSTLEQLPSDYRNTFIRHVKNLRIVGIDVFYEGDKGNFIQNYDRLILFTAFLLQFGMSQVLFLLMSDASFVDKAYAVLVIVIVSQDLLKTYDVFMKRRQIKELILEIAELWPTEDVYRDEQKCIKLKSFLRRSKNFDNCYYTCVVSGTMVYLWTPMFITIYNTIMDTNAFYLYPFNFYPLFEINTFLKYAISYIANQFIPTSSVQLCVYVACDSLLANLTTDVSTLLYLLQMDLENVVKPRIDNNSPTPKQSYDDIKNIAKTHQKILKLVDRLNEIFGLELFVHIIISSLAICLLGFLAMVYRPYIFFGQFAIMYNIFNISWPGQLLYDTSSEVADAAYRSLWYETDVKFREFILIIMMRSQRPCYLCALGFANFTLTSFTKSISTAWSYFSLINQMYKDSEISI